MQPSPGSLTEEGWPDRANDFRQNGSGCNDCQTAEACKNFEQGFLKGQFLKERQAELDVVFTEFAKICTPIFFLLEGDDLSKPLDGINRMGANSPAASLDLEPRSSTLLRIKKGLSPTKIKNGMKARATHGWVIVRKMTTTKGTSTETNAGALCGRKNTLQAQHPE